MLEFIDTGAEVIWNLQVDFFYKLSIKLFQYPTESIESLGIDL